MKYLLLIYSSPQTWNSLSQVERDQLAQDHAELNQRLRESGELIGGEALADPSQARAVRVRDGRTIVTDGPYLEAKEHLAGYDVLECDTPERALDIATGHPHARVSAVELRPIMDLGGAEL